MARPRSEPKKADWDRLRPRAEDLYRVQKKKIKDVVDILQKESNLRITSVSIIAFTLVIH